MCADVSSAAMQDRLQNVQELCEFSEKCRKQLNEVLEELGWSPDRNLQPSQEKMEVCPYDRNHTVPSKSMESHKATCLLSQLKYSKEEQAELCDPSFYYERSNVPTIKLDKQTQHQVILQAQASAPSLQSPGNYCQRDYSTEPADVPQNHKRAICDLTPADRLALYDYVIQKATQQSAKAQASNNEDLYVDLVSKLKKGDKNSGPKSHLEVLAEMRDYRRRRQSYRAKNVHITKKSYTEIIREVIDVHAEELSRVWHEERKDESKPSNSHSSRRASNEVRSASVESRGPRTDSREGHSSRRKHRKSSREHRKESKSRRRDSKSPEERHRKKKKKRSRS